MKTEREDRRCCCPDCEGGGRKWCWWFARILAGAALFAAGFAVKAGLLSAPDWSALALFAASYILTGGDVLFRAAENARGGVKKIFDENFLMGVASLGAFAIGEYPEGVAVMLFYQIGEACQERAVERSRRSITALMDIRPDFANLKTDGGLKRVAPEEVAVGDVIAVKPGEKVPLDGVVTDGRTELDTSALTGESMPRCAAPGDEVLSGSINKSGLISVRVSKEFGESTVSKILRLTQSAGEKKARVESFITRFAAVYTPAVVAAAAALGAVPPMLGFGAWAEWTHRALVFLVASCPCALVISIPLGFFAGIGGASRNGVLVKGGVCLEALGDVDTVVFDKTGTLTTGRFRVTGVEALEPRMTQEELLSLAAMAESASDHPIAASIRRAAPAVRGSVSEAGEIAGKGTRAVIDGVEVLVGNAALMDEFGVARDGGEGRAVYVARGGACVGRIGIADEVKPDGRAAVDALRKLGVRRVVMLTGDAREAAEDVAARVGLDPASVSAGLLPHQKLERLDSLKETGGRLVYVGDGINDAPALARADVGIAMGGVGSDAAVEAADIVLMTDEPSKVAVAIRVARKTSGIVRWNVAFILAVKAVVLALGALGEATMWAAVFADVGTALLAVANSSRAGGELK
ncbi:MAG: cadmium-translocating P-type ATPase [Synergistaceae bacterium]|jgi:Cd2+/Zn2+-exporting ATPase|nr:cadmium-translocating P-type ATPase [Synergistaceae bacterium]